jgi:hypothetical protein
LAAAFVAALSPFQVYYAQETRMYMLLALLSTLVVWLALEVWRAEADWPLRPAAGYIVAVTMGLYSQYAFPIMLLVINLVALASLWRTKRRLWLWFGLQFIPLLLYLPWLPVAARQITVWPSLREAASPATVTMTLLQHLALGLPAPAVPKAWPAAMMGLALFGLVRGWRYWGGDPAKVQGLGLVALWLLLPAGLAATLFRPAYLKIFLIASPAFCLLAGLGIIGLSWPWGRYVWPVLRLLPFLAAALIAWPSLLALNAYFHDSTYHRDNYRAIAAFIQAVGTEADAVIIHAPGQQEVFGYYYRPGPGRSAIYPLPRQRPMDWQQTMAGLEKIKRESNRLYGIFWATEEADPVGLIEDWLNRNTFKASDIWFGNARLASYATLEQPVPLAEMDVRFGDHIRLVRAGYSPGKIAPGEILGLHLVWQTDTPLSEDYTVFVQLLDEANHLIGQRDAAPSTPTTEWTPGEAIAGQYGLYLEPGTPPSPLRLIVGLYRSDTGERLPVGGGGDFFELGTVLGVNNQPSPLPAEAFRPQHPLSSPLLLGYDLYKLGHASEMDTPLHPGDPLHLNLYWRRPHTETVDLRLADREGDVITSWQFPVAGVDFPLSEWKEDQIVRGQYDMFLSEAPPGRYQLEIWLGGETVSATGYFEVSR